MDASVDLLKAGAMGTNKFGRSLVTTGEVIKNIGSLLIMLTLLVFFGFIFYIVVQVVF